MLHGYNFRTDQIFFFRHTDGWASTFTALQSNKKWWSSLIFSSTKCDCLCLQRSAAFENCSEKSTYHVREKVGGMFIEADDSLPQLVSLQAIREGPHLPLHFWPWIHVGEQLPERQPVGHMEGSCRTCCSEGAWMDLNLCFHKCLQSKLAH